MLTIILIILFFPFLATLFYIAAGLGFVVISIVAQGLKEVFIDPFTAKRSFSERAGNVFVLFCVIGFFSLVVAL